MDDFIESTSTAWYSPTEEQSPIICVEPLFRVNPITILVPGHSTALD
jgi:hypothetical protein